MTDKKQRKIEQDKKQPPNIHPSDLLPQAKPHLLNFLESPQISHQLGAKSTIYEPLGAGVVVGEQSVGWGPYYIQCITFFLLSPKDLYTFHNAKHIQSISKSPQHRSKVQVQSLL
jgi:hypothetical protein